MPQVPNPILHNPLDQAFFLGHGVCSVGNKETANKKHLCVAVAALVCIHILRQGLGGNVSVHRFGQNAPDQHYTKQPL